MFEGNDFQNMTFIPLHVNNNHWALIVINGQENRIEFYDTLRRNGKPYCSKVREFMSAEMGRNFDEHEWPIMNGPEFRDDIPRQNDSHR